MARTAGRTPEYAAWFAEFIIEQHEAALEHSTICNPVQVARQLTIVQARCTELLEEVRALKSDDKVPPNAPAQAGHCESNSSGCARVGDRYARLPCECTCGPCQTLRRKTPTKVCPTCKGRAFVCVRHKSGECNLLECIGRAYCPACRKFPHVNPVTHCSDCGESWDEHDFGVPKPYCPPTRACPSPKTTGPKPCSGCGRTGGQTFNPGFCSLCPPNAWGIWCERDGEPGFWQGTASGPVRTTRADAERRAANHNERQKTRTDSIGWRYEARPWTPEPVRARLDRDGTAKGRTILSAPMVDENDNVGRTGIVFPADTHVDLETGKRTALHASKVLCALCLQPEHTVETWTDCPATREEEESGELAPVEVTKSAALNDAAHEWLKDHASDDSLGAFADTRAGGDLLRLLVIVDELAEKRARRVTK